MISVHPIESLRSLEQAISGYTALGDAVCENNIIKNRVLITGVANDLKEFNSPYLKAGSGNGLLLTTDGFIITAYHVIENYLKNWTELKRMMPSGTTEKLSWLEKLKPFYNVKDLQGKEHPIDMTCMAFNKKLDIALIKAVIQKKPEPIRYKFLGRDLTYGEDIKLVSLNQEMRHCEQFGKIVGPYLGSMKIGSPGTKNTEIFDTFITDAYATPGYSGSVFTTLNWEIAGVASYISVPTKTEKIGPAGGSKIKNMITLVNKAICQLKATHSR
jgi:hypothetical protein